MSGQTAMAAEQLRLLPETLGEIQSRRRRAANQYRAANNQSTERRVDLLLDFLAAVYDEREVRGS